MDPRGIYNIGLAIEITPHGHEPQRVDRDVIHMMTNRYICIPPSARVSKIRQCENFLTTANQKGRRAFIELGHGSSMMSFCHRV